MFHNIPLSNDKHELSYSINVQCKYNKKPEYFTTVRFNIIKAQIFLIRIAFKPCY